MHTIDEAKKDLDDLKRSIETDIYPIIQEKNPEVLLFDLNMGYESTSRNSGNRTKHSEANYTPFELKFRLPKLRKSRIIFEKNELGKIVRSKPPAIV